MLDCLRTRLKQYPNFGLVRGVRERGVRKGLEGASAEWNGSTQPRLRAIYGYAECAIAAMPASSQVSRGVREKYQVVNAQHWRFAFSVDQSQVHSGFSETRTPIGRPCHHPCGISVTAHVGVDFACAWQLREGGFIKAQTH